MAAIDKLYAKYYSDARNLVAWVLNNRPSMLDNIYYISFDEEQFNEHKNDIYIYDLAYNRINYERWELDKGREHAINKLLDYYKSWNDFDASSVHPDEKIDEIYEQHEKLSDKELYISDIELPIACFTLEQDTWLKWHCPLEFVRQYLKDNCGIKEHWYYKLFFKY